MSRPDPAEWITRAQLARLLGTSAKGLTAHMGETYAWLPTPIYMDGRPYWPRNDTLTAIIKGRPRLPKGWHTVPGCPTVEVYIPGQGRCPTHLRVSGPLPDGYGAVSVLLDTVETILPTWAGYRVWCDTPSPCGPGTYPLRPDWKL